VIEKGSTSSRSAIGLLSISYLGPIQYFTKFLIYQRIIIERFDHYTKQTFRNRSIIYGANGSLTLSIPVIKGDEHKTYVKDVRIDYGKGWQKLHWKGIESAYRSSPFYEFYIDILSDFYFKRYTFLFDFNMEILSRFLEFLEISVSPELSEEYLSPPPGDIVDLREIIHPKKSYKSDPSFSPVRYNQVFQEKHGFLPNLSIIDLICNEGPNAGQFLRKSIRK